jgi:hypothetical protein
LGGMQIRGDLGVFGEEGVWSGGLGRPQGGGGLPERETATTQRGGRLGDPRGAG